MSTVSRRRRTGTAIVAAGTLLLTGALPAAAQTASQPPSGGAGQSGQSATTPGGGSSTGTTGGSSAAGQSSQQQKKHQTGKSSQGAGLSHAQLRRHARADMVVEQKAPDVYAKVEHAKDLNTELSQEERQKLSQALQGSGYTLAQYAGEHHRIMASPKMQSQLQHMEQQVKAQGGQQGPASQSGAGKAPSGRMPPSTGGAPSGSQSMQPSGSASPAAK
ncbi:MAG TPA: hypothetical protein VF406_13340 [Thermodesulfobacteriota bacterium]